MGLSLLLLTLLMLAVDKPGRLITFDVSVTDKNNNPVGGLRREDFKVFEDNIEQPLTRFGFNREPAAVVALVEYTDKFNQYGLDVIDPAVGFVRTLSPQDWGAVVSFDFMPRIVTDFTHDTGELVRGLRSLQMPRERDAALYDAVYFTLDRMEGMNRLEGKRAIVLFGTGTDTMSNKRTFGEALKMAEVSDTAIYTIDLARSVSLVVTPDSDYGREIRMSSAEQTLAAFADASGGLAFAPLFEGQYWKVYETVNADLHSRYTLSFVSTSAKEPGKVRKLKVQVANRDLDSDGKPDKLKIRHKTGHTGAR